MNNDMQFYVKYSKNYSVSHVLYRWHFNIDFGEFVISFRYHIIDKRDVKTACGDATLWVLFISYTAAHTYDRYSVRFGEMR